MTLMQATRQEMNWRRIISVLILTLTSALFTYNIFLWTHFHKIYPVFDDAQYFAVTQQIYQTFLKKNTWDFFKDLYLIRSLRPFIHPIWGVLPLILSRGDVGGSLRLYFMTLGLGLNLCLYLLAKRYLPPLHTFLLLLLINFLPWIIPYLCTYSSEVPLLLGCLVLGPLLFDDNIFMDRRKSLCLGLALGILFCIRPILGFVHVFIPLMTLMYLSKKEGQIGIMDICMGIFPIAAFSLMFLPLKRNLHSFEGFHYYFFFLAVMASIVLSRLFFVRVRKSYGTLNSNFFLFSILSTMIPIIWLFPFLNNIILHLSVGREYGTFSEGFTLIRSYKGIAQTYGELWVPMLLLGLAMAARPGTANFHLNWMFLRNRNLLLYISIFPFPFLVSPFIFQDLRFFMVPVTYALISLLLLFLRATKYLKTSAAVLALCILSLMIGFYGSFASSTNLPYKRLWNYETHWREKSSPAEINAFLEAIVSKIPGPPGARIGLVNLDLGGDISRIIHTDTLNLAIREQGSKIDISTPWSLCMEFKGDLDQAKEFLGSSYDVIILGPLNIGKYHKCFARIGHSFKGDKNYFLKHHLQFSDILNFHHKKVDYDFWIFSRARMSI